MHLKNDQGNRVFSFGGAGRCYAYRHEAGEYEQSCMIPANFLNWGNFSIDFLAFTRGHHLVPLANESDLISFTVGNRQVAIGGYMGREPGDITPKFDFIEKKL
jgi:hypothetical protein